MSDPMTPLELVAYYANLLILQYIGKPKAYAMISSICAPAIMPQVSTQQILFSDVAASGSFVLQYQGNNTTTIQWNDSVSTIEGYLQALSGLSAVTVTGSIASQTLTIVFTDVFPPVELLIIDTNTLLNVSSEGISVTVTETDQTLPLAVQNAFNLSGDTAIGVQLDIIGKYCGVTRTGNGPYGPITLDDTDFLILIQFAIVQNNSGSSLLDIETNLNKFFPGQFIVSDFGNMFMSYVFTSSLGSQNLFLLLLAENLIPHPMGVGITVIIPPDITQFFGFRTYDRSNNFAKPFNTYDSFNTNWFWLSYSEVFT